MSVAECRQMSRVEALHDGRLEAREAAVIEWHLESCSACADEMRRFRALRQELDRLPEPEFDAASVARSRTRLLQTAMRQASPDAMTPSWQSRPVLAWGSVALAVVAPWRAGSAAGPAAALNRATNGASGETDRTNEFLAEVSAVAAARWVRRNTALSETIELQEGEIEIRVRRHEPRFRFAVRLPDGEIEDLGTTFTVNVCDGHTERVAVQEGSVVLRLRERDPITLHAGEHWETTRPHDSSEPPEQAPKAASTPAEDTAVRAVAPKSAANLCVGSATFERANEAYKQARWQTAALAFAQFSAECPRDSRAEDAAYLRMVAWARAGRSGDARSAALAYLAHFPSGFRHKEAQHLVSGD